VPPDAGGLVMASSRTRPYEPPCETYPHLPSRAAIE